MARLQGLLVVGVVFRTAKDPQNGLQIMIDNGDHLQY